MLTGCPYCGSIVQNISDEYSHAELRIFEMSDTYPVACRNPICSVNPKSNNKLWNKHVESIKRSKYLNEYGDVDGR